MLLTPLSPAAVAQVTAAPPTDATFVSVTPARLLDTRPGFTTTDGQQAGTGIAAAASTTKVTINGRAGLPLTGVGSVVLNVTVVDPQGSGYITAWPTGQTKPNASNVNFANGQIVPNLVITKLGADGTVSLFTSAATHLIADVTGYLPTTSSFVGLQPARLLDTRPGYATIDGQQAGVGIVAAGNSTKLVVAGRAGLPVTGVGSVVLNATVVNPQGPGYITVWPSDLSQPNASNLNYTQGGVVPNLVVTRVARDGTVMIFNSATTDLVVDITGYFPTNSNYASVPPARLMDTRPSQQTVDGLQAGEGRVAPGSDTKVYVSGRAGARGGVAVLNITVVDPLSAGFVSVTPIDYGMPTTSNLNFQAGQTVANMVVVLAGGPVNIHSSASTHLVVDIAGVFPGGLQPGGCSDSPISATPTSAPPHLFALVSVCAIPIEGGNTTFSVKVRNEGSAIAANQIKATLRTSLQSGTPIGDGWVCSVKSGGDNFWDCFFSGSVGPGETLPLIRVADQRESISAVLSVVGEAITYNAFTSATAASVDHPDLVLALTADTVPTVNENFSYKATIRNFGRLPEQGPIRVSRTISGVASGIGWTCDDLYCEHAGPLPAGGTVPALSFSAPNSMPYFVVLKAYGSAAEWNTSNNEGALSTLPLPVDSADVMATFSQLVPTAAGALTGEITTRVGPKADIVGPVDVIVDDQTAVLTGAGWDCTYTSPRRCRLQGLPKAGATLPTISFSETNWLSVGRAKVHVSTPNDSRTSGFSSDVSTAAGYQFQQIGQTFAFDGPAKRGGVLRGQVLTRLPPQAAQPIVVTFDPVEAPFSSLSGTGWTCTLAIKKCTYQGPITGLVDLPPIVFSRSVALDENYIQVSLVGAPVQNGRVLAQFTASK